MRPLLVFAVASLSLGLTAHAASMTYTVDETVGAASATGTLTTDGILGVLSSADIQSYTFTLANSAGSQTYTEDPSHLIVIGPDLSTTDAGLFFNFSEPGFAGISFVGTTRSDYLCLSAAGATCSGTVGSVEIRSSGVTSTSETLTGVQQIGTAVTPEPASFVLLGTGVFGVAGVRRRPIA